MASKIIRSPKSLLRNELRAALKKISPSLRVRKSRKIITRLLRSRYYRQAQNIFTYVATPAEVNTRELIRQALRTGKSISVPKVYLGKHRIEAVRIKHPRQGLRRGAYGILEPGRAERMMQIRPSLLDLVVVPGLGFDRRGRRLGRGAGYFDRFLRRAKRAKKVALAFREQLVEKIPVEQHDVLMDAVITD